MPIGMIQNSIFAFLMSRYIVLVGDRFYGLGGLPMGLVLAAMCLSLNMVMVENVKRLQLHQDPAFT